MPDDPNGNQDRDVTDPRVARRLKLDQILKRGIDPYGSRFDDRSLVSQCRELSAEIRFQQQDGTLLELPDVQSDDIDYRQWKSDNSPGE
ncbi:MAG: lysine--tRNA ligase, partial [Planctomycetota bacterium]